MRRGLVTFCILGATALWQSSSVVARHRPDTNSFGFKISSYKVHNASIVEALRRLKVSVGEEPLILTLEVVPFREKPENNLTLVLEHSSVKKVLERITAQDPRYTYEVIDSHLIHVFPRGSTNDPDDLLNIKVKRFDVLAGSYDLLLKYPQYHIPELEVELMRRSRAGGMAVSMLGGGDVPKITLNLRDVTVRDILNSIALETLQFRTGRHNPTGWIYTFRIDKSVPLGGHPRWNLF